jgi:hypothetical protein
MSYLRFWPVSWDWEMGLRPNALWRCQDVKPQCWHLFLKCFRQALVLQCETVDEIWWRCGKSFFINVSLYESFWCQAEFLLRVAKVAYQLKVELVYVRCQRLRKWIMKASITSGFAFKRSNWQQTTLRLQPTLASHAVPHEHLRRVHFLNLVKVDGEARTFTRAWCRWMLKGRINGSIHVISGYLHECTVNLPEAWISLPKKSFRVVFFSGYFFLEWNWI